MKVEVLEVARGKRSFTWFRSVVPSAMAMTRPLGLVDRELCVRV